MQNVSRVDVYAVDKHVGTLAEYERGLIAFEYSQEWLESGFSISPFSLPLEKKLFVPSSKELGGLFGVFDDSLPDGWGRLLTDRYLRLKGFDASEVNQLERLLLLPDTAFGRLEYKPRQDFSSIVNTNDFDHFFEASKAILDDFKISEDDVEKLYKYGGSSGGARPKINALIDGELWIVKLPSSGDGIDAGIKEYECNKRAVDAGLDVSDFMLVDSKLTKGFFASKRFDHKDGCRVHMVSLAGLLESSYRYPALDYSHLLKATFLLTRSEQEVYEAFRRACFNVFIDNQDDHVRILHSYMMKSKESGIFLLRMI